MYALLSLSVHIITFVHLTTTGSWKGFQDFIQNVTLVLPALSTQYLSSLSLGLTAWPSGPKYLAVVL